jgi:hypothetical protein
VVADNDIPNKKYVDDKLLAKAIRTTAINTTITSADYTVVGTTTLTVTLPVVSTVTGYVFNIKHRGLITDTITIDGDGAETIDGNLTISLGQNDNLTIQSTGTEWIIL